MQIILLEKVTNLGNLGDVVRVKDGFARNFLIPQRKARRATEAAIADFALRRAELEKLAAEKLAAAEAVGAKLKDLVLEIGQKAGVDGRLFGSVTNHDVADGLKAKGTGCGALMMTSFLTYWGKAAAKVQAIAPPQSWPTRMQDLSSRPACRCSISCRRSSSRCFVR